MTKETKKKKSIFKRWWFWVVAFIIVVAAASGGSGEDTATKEDTAPKQETKKETAVKKEDTATTEDTTEYTATEEAAAEPAEEENDPGISKAEFDKIQAGMTYEEVVEIIGGEGELNSESGAKGDQYYTAMYTWNGESGFGANANATFQGNPAKLQNKSQFGLE
jgi:hypothetical protein